MTTCAYMVFIFVCTVQGGSPLFDASRQFCPGGSGTALAALPGPLFAYARNSMILLGISGHVRPIVYAGNDARIPLGCGMVRELQGEPHARGRVTS